MFVYGRALLFFFSFLDLFIQNSPGIFFWGSCLCIPHDLLSSSISCILVSSLFLGLCYYFIAWSGSSWVFCEVIRVLCGGETVVSREVLKIVCGLRHSSIYPGARNKQSQTIVRNDHWGALFTNTCSLVIFWVWGRVAVIRLSYRKTNLTSHFPNDGDCSE